jgi:hypothetical protein
MLQCCISPDTMYSCNRLQFILMHKQGARVRAMAERLSTLSHCEQVTSLNRKQLSEELKRRVADIRELLARHVSQARQMIRTLVPQLDCTPFREGNEKGYRFSGDGSYGQLLSGESSATKCGVTNGS